MSEWREFPSSPCLAGKETWWQLASRCCWNRARPWHASELVSFLVGLKIYQHPGLCSSNLYDFWGLIIHRKSFYWMTSSRCSKSGRLVFTLHVRKFYIRIFKIFVKFMFWRRRLFNFRLIGAYYILFCATPGKFKFALFFKILCRIGQKICCLQFSFIILKQNFDS